MLIVPSDFTDLADAINASSLTEAEVAGLLDRWNLDIEIAMMAKMGLTTVHQFDLGDGGTMVSLSRPGDDDAAALAAWAAQGRGLSDAHE